MTLRPGGTKLLSRATFPQTRLDGYGALGQGVCWQRFEVEGQQLVKRLVLIRWNGGANGGEQHEAPATLATGAGPLGGNLWAADIAAELGRDDTAAVTPC